MKIIDDAVLDLLSCQAKSSERFRKNLNIHEHDDDLIQRLINALEPNTYVCPHKHQNPAKRELFIPLRGQFQLVIFDDLGEITSVIRLSEKSTARIVEILPSVYHSLVCEEEGTVYIEIKDGPYDKNSDKTFAPWAPLETYPMANEYLEELKKRISVFEDEEEN